MAIVSKFSNRGIIIYITQIEHVIMPARKTEGEVTNGLTGVE